MRENNLEKVLYGDHFTTDYPAVFETVTGWFEKGFEEFKTTTALSFGDEHFSYDELDKQSNKIANYLASREVGSGDRVGISLDRSIEMITCLIGILKSGAAYVPLDPNYPVDRLGMMSEDARLSLLVAHQKFSDRFEKNADYIVLWEEIEKDIYKQPDSFAPRQIDGEDAAYVIFTSGSTGRPKGIEMPHRALANLVEWQLEREYFKKEARVLQYSSISFDVSFQEIASTFASGGTLFLIRDDDRRDPRILLDVLDRLNIERLFIPFVALRSMVEVAITTQRLPGSLREVITAGEQLRVDNGLRDFFAELPDARFENQYGPSETHVISAYLLDKNPEKWNDLPPIGTPIKNNSIFILDENMKAVENGEQGELYLAGRNVAHGYLGRKDLTEKSFIKNPVDMPGREILYKTGDLGIRNEDGDIEFLGRADHQIKIRGYRVEPGEINSVGVEYEGIEQCLTHAVRDQADNAQLVTYYVAQQGVDVNKDDFKTHLSDILPEYMVPSFIVELDNIPYTPSGKVDLKALPKPEKQVLGFDEKVVYHSEVEQQLAEIWCKILGYDNIPRSANFFDLGGDSLNAVTLFMEIEEQFGKHLPLSVLTQASTIEELAAVIEGKNKDLDVSRFRSLQLIQRGSVNNVPLFLVHGGAGNVLMFRDLAKKLPRDQPVYAFQWPGWDGDEGINEISEMAKFYKKELREAWPNGPYRLGGYCIGGLIVLEIAELLKNEGAEIIDPILVADSPNLHSKHFYPGFPKSTTEKKAFEKLQRRLESILTKNSNGEVIQKTNNTKQDKDYSERRYPLLAKYLPFYFKLGKIYLKLTRFAQQKIQDARVSFRMKLSLKIPVKDRRRYCQFVQIAAVKNYKKTVYNGDILYLKSEALHGNDGVSIEGWWDDLFFGFEELCNGRFEAHMIGGNHNDILQSELTHTIIKKKMLDR